MWQKGGSMDVNVLGAYVDGIFAEQELRQAKELQAQHRSALMQYRSWLQRKLKLPAKLARVLQYSLFWGALYDLEFEDRITREDFILRNLPALADVRPGEVSDCASQFSKMLHRVCRKEMQLRSNLETQANDDIPEICLVLLVFVRDELIRGEQPALHIETLLLMQKAAQRWSLAAPNGWWEVSTLIRRTFVGLLCDSSDSVLRSIAPLLFRGRAASLFLRDNGDYFWEAFRTASPQRQREIYWLLDECAMQPSRSFFDYFRNRRDAKLRKSIIEAVRKEF